MSLLDAILIPWQQSLKINVYILFKDFSYSDQKNGGKLKPHISNAEIMKHFEVEVVNPSPPEGKAGPPSVSRPST